MWVMASKVLYFLGLAGNPDEANNDQTYGSFEDLQTALLPPSMNGVDDDNMDEIAGKKWYENPHQITAMISNFSTSYNVVNISLVLPILKELYSNNSDKDTAVVASSLLAGMIFGQLVGGALGDSWLGRMGALRLVMALQIVASIASTVLGRDNSGDDGGGEDIFLWLAGWRFVLGIGCGGVYPLAAVISAEEGKQQQQHNNGSSSSSVQRVVLTFSMQGVGFVSVPLVAVFLLFCTSNLNLVWRIMLGLGALPGVVMMCIQCHTQFRRRIILPGGAFPEIQPNDEVGSDGELENDSVLASVIGPVEIENNQIATMEPLVTDDTDNNDESNSDGGGWLKTLLHEPGLGRKVLGTAGTWFLFDVVFYGNTIFQPIVVEAAFGNKGGHAGIHLLRKTALDSLILTSIALPGYAMAGIIMGKKTGCVTQTPRYVMLQGFAAMTVLYATIGFNWSYLRGDPAMLVFLYGMTFFFANYGPNTTTFILPSLMFEEEHRATWNGVSAAAGKLGALTGATLFAPAANEFGDSVVLLICAGVALVALLLTYFALPEQDRNEDGTMMERSESAASVNSSEDV